MLPDIYSAQAYVDAVASNYYKYLGAFSGNDPSTPFYQLRQISTFLDTGNILGGVWDDSATAFTLTFDNTNNLFNVSQGTIRYNSVDYVIAAQSLGYAPLFNTYTASDYYIATIFADVVTLSNNSLVTITASQPASVGATTIYVREKTKLSSIKPPSRLQIGSNVYQVGSIDVYSGKITLSASSATIATAILTDSKMYLIQEPLLGCVYTAPFSASGDVFLSSHLNKVILPQNTIRMYDILMQDPSDPAVVTTGGAVQSKTVFTNFNKQTPDASGSQALSLAIKNFNFNLTQSQSALDLDIAVTNFNAATQQQSPTGNISDFWLNTIMLQPEIASVGVDLGRYKKFDFPDNYLAANYKFNDGNLYELLYAFDPTYYSNTNIYSGNTSVSNLSSTLLANYGPVSRAAPTLIVHGITATVNTNYPSGETPINYQSTTTAVATNANSAFEIKYTPLSGSVYAYYNAYRKSVDNNLSIDLPLSAPMEIQGDPNFGAELPASPTSGSENFTGFTGAYTILNTTGSTGRFAFKFIPRLPAGSLSSKVFVGGVAVTMSASVAYTGNASIQALLVSPNPDLNTYTLLGSSALMPVQNITTTSTEFSFKFEQATSGTLNLTPASTYYVILLLSNADTTSVQIFGDVVGATGSTLSQGYTGSWGNVADLAYNFRTLGFIDNISNSGSVIDSTLPLSNYVFRGVRKIRNKLTRPRSIYAYVPFFITNSDGTNVSTPLENDIIVNLVGLNSETGNVVDTNYVTVPAGTASGNKVLLTGNEKVDTVTYVSIQPGSGATLDSSGQVVWGVYDYILIIGDE